jgi:N-acetylglucosaminyldiphosphoundecaprenol N-acetyl-beta-D-mannosaminyltransferase
MRLSSDVPLLTLNVSEWPSLIRIKGFAELAGSGGALRTTLNSPTIEAVGLTDDGPMPQEVRLFDYPVHLVSLREALEAAQEALNDERTLHVVTLNPEMIMQGDSNPELGAILKSAGLVLPDGAGLVWALRQRGHSVKRLPGIEFSEAMIQRAAETGLRVAFIGATQEVLEAAIDRLRAKATGLTVVYSHHGFFKPEEASNIAKACAAEKPQLVFVALGVPRQEQWIAQNMHLFHGAVLVGVGGSFDVWSGKTQRAPALMRRLNLEWAYRITTEPWRIQRTYKTLPMFVVKVLLSRGSS